MSETGKCDEFVNNNKDDYISWRASRDPAFITKELGIKWMRHFPLCSSCLAHDNSYAFAAWYNMKASRVERLIALYEKYYPNNLRQPLFFAGYDNTVDMRMFDTQDVLDDNGEIDGEINLDTMIVNFHMTLSKPKYDRETKEKDDTPWKFDERNFDLKTQEGWQQLLKFMPQKVVQ